MSDQIQYLADNCSNIPTPFGNGCIATRVEETIPNSFSWDLPNDFGTADASVTYLHAISDIVGGVTYFYPPAVTNPTSPIVCTDVTSIQSWIDSLGFDITYTVNSLNEIIVYFGVPGEETRFSFWMGESYPDGYTNKLVPTVIGAQVDEFTYQEVQVVKEKQTDGTFIDRFFLPGDGILTEVFADRGKKVSFGKCPEDCWTPTSICKCYGGGSETTFNDTDGVDDMFFSCNTTYTKWYSVGTDGSDLFTQAIRECIFRGGVAQLTLTTTDNLVFTFNATAIDNDSGGTSGIGDYSFFGNAPTAGSGSISSATLVCSTGRSGTACLFTNCKGEQEWRDVTLRSGTNDYTVISQDSLVDCPTDCSVTETVELIACANETTPEANIGDYILTIATICVDSREVLGFTAYNVTNGNTLLVNPVLTISCEPTPQIQEIQNCIKDADGVKWSQIAVVLTTVPPTIVTNLYYNLSNLALGTPAGDSTKWTSCDCNLTPDCCYCFCAMMPPLVKSEKAGSTGLVKATICTTNWRDCDLKVVKRTYTIDGKDVPEATFLKLKYSKISCTDPIPTYTPGTPTCATYPDPIYGVIVLNVTIFTNDTDPTDTFTVYNLADNYAGLGNIGDVYLPADELLISACDCSPLPDCITVTEDCYEALTDIKGVANQGDTITVTVTNNALTGTSLYNIIHTATGSLIYSGTDPLSAGIDLNNATQWVLSPCDPVLPEVYDIREKEVCGTIDGSAECYELIKIYTRNPLTGESTTLFYETVTGVKVTGTVVEVCCTCDCLCELPTLNMRCMGYQRENGNKGWISGYESAPWVGNKVASNADYDTFITDVGFASLVGAPRGLRYIIEVANVNGDTSAQGTIIDIPVPTANFETVLANVVNTALGFDIFYYDGIGWSFQYNTAWTTLEVVVTEYADNHIGGYQLISFGGWGVRLNGTTLEDGIGVDPLNINSGNWFTLSNCTPI